MGATQVQQMLQAYVLGLFTSEYALNKAHEMFLHVHTQYWPVVYQSAMRYRDLLLGYFVKKRVVVRTIEETFGDDE